MHDQVQWMIEGADGDHDADWLFLREGEPARRCRRRADRDHVAGVAAQRFGAEFDAVDRPDDLDFGIDVGFTAFAGGKQG